MAKSFRNIFDTPGATAVSSVRPPRATLDELASTLSIRARSKIRFDVETVTPDNRRVTHTLSAVVPRLDGYILQLLSASHDVLKLYPVTLSGLLFDKPLTVTDEDQLFDALAVAFTAEPFNDIFGTLIAQA